MTWNTRGEDQQSICGGRAFIQHRFLVNLLIHLRRRTQLADVVGNASGTRGGLTHEFFLANLLGRGEGAPSANPLRAT